MRFFFIFLLLPLLALAQEEEKTSAPLTLEAAVKEALEKSPGVTAALAAIEVAQGERKATSNYQVQPELALSLENGLSGVDRLELSVQQSLPTGGKLALAKKIGDARIAALESNLQAVRVSVAAKTARAYVAFWVTSERVALSKERAALAKTSREAAEKRSTSGETSKLELLLVQAEEERARAEVTSAAGERAQAQLGLAAVLGRPFSELLSVSIPQVKSTNTLASVDAILAQVENNPQLQAATNEIEASSAELTLAKKALVPSPSLRLGGSFNQLRIDSSDFLGTPAALNGIEGIKQSEGQLFIEFSSSIPLLRQGYQGAIAASLGKVAFAESRRDELKRNVSVDLLTARARLLSAVATEELLLVSTPRYEEVATLTEKGYSSGQLSLDSLLLARNRLYEARGALLSSQAATLEENIALQEASGKIPE